MPVLPPRPSSTVMPAGNTLKSLRQAMAMEAAMDDDDDDDDEFDIFQTRGGTLQKRPKPKAGIYIWEKTMLVLVWA